METLGIIGGMGPMATAYLLELVIQMTNAKTDQEHLRTIVFDNPQVPDRTAYILDREKPSPLPVLEDMAQTLERIGCGVLCAPCVTSHYFYPELSSSVSVPFLHMVEETARELQEAGRKKAGILATTGTVSTGLFQRALEKFGIEWAAPSQLGQGLVMSLIYDDVKSGRDGDPQKFAAIHRDLEEQGCDCGVLACTELSVFSSQHHLPPFYLDAMAVLAERSIQACHGRLQHIFTK